MPQNSFLLRILRRWSGIRECREPETILSIFWWISAILSSTILSRRTCVCMALMSIRVFITSFFMKENRSPVIWSSRSDVLSTKKSEKCTISGRSTRKILSSKMANIPLSERNKSPIFSIFSRHCSSRRWKFLVISRLIIDIVWIRRESSQLLDCEKNKKYRFALCNFIPKIKKCWLYLTIFPQTNSDSDFLNFWKSMVADCNIQSESLKTQIVSWQSSCWKSRKNLQKDLKIRTVSLYLRCVNDVKRKFTDMAMPCMRKRNSSLCSIISSLTS